MTPGRLLRLLEQLGLTHLVGLPDNTSGPLLGGGGALRRVEVTREGEAFAIASGLWIGGGQPAVVIQSTGLLESGDALRGTAVRMRVPLLCLVTDRGRATLASRPVDRTPETLSSAAFDSVALLAEPTLAAWGIPWTRLEAGRAESVLREAVGRARRDRFPSAVLLERLEPES